MANKRITDVDFLSTLDSNESFFVNRNNTLKQISKSDIVFGVENGGTGATNIESARKNLGVVTAEELKNDLKSIGAQSQHITTVAILYATEWSNNSQTVTVDDVTSENTVIVGSHPSYQTIYSDNGVLCVEQKDKALVFNCESTPLSDIQVNIIIMN